VWLEKTTDGISLFDEEGSNRKLLASPSSGFAGTYCGFSSAAARRHGF